MKSLFSFLFALVLWSGVNAQISIIGTASPAENWDIDYYLKESTPGVWIGTFELNAGELKFRQDGNWTNNWGNSDFPSGTAISFGPNIPVPTAGYYTITFNLTNLFYSFELKGRVGINNNDPKAGLDLEGGFITRVDVIGVNNDNNSAYIPLEKSFVWIESANAPYTIDIEQNYRDGSRIVIFNGTSHPATYLSFSIPSGVASELIMLDGEFRLIGSVSNQSGSSSWNITGNSDTDPNTDFIGTTDNQPLVFKTNNTTRMEVKSDGAVSIGTSPPATSAILDVQSTSAGFLPPRMTKAQRDAIPTPLSEGLTVYNASSNCLETWDGAQWYGPCTNLAANYPAGTVFCNDIVTKVVPVLNPYTGRTWMDRNLGASRAAISSTDAQAYGSLYQWGRGSDGHQCVHRFAGDGVTNSNTTSTVSGADQPGHGNFILTTASPHDWRSPHNDNLWQGVNGINNPCPTGYRLPTETELNNERISWVQPLINSTNNAAGAFASPLKLPVAGHRGIISGLLFNEDTSGSYRSSTVIGTSARYLFFLSSDAFMAHTYRAYGFSVRCIKD